MAFGAAPCCNLNVWYHFIMTWDSVELIVYINGSQTHVQQSESRGSYIASDYDDLTFGRPNNMASYSGQFVVDEMYYWNRTLTSAEVHLLYNQYSQSEYSYLRMVLPKIRAVYL